MGLNTSFGAWDGPYSSFGEFRRKLAERIGIKLSNMEGFGGSISFKTVKHDIKPLLNHSDCDGHLTVLQCKRVAKGLESILKEMDIPEDKVEAFEADWFVRQIKKFINGCNQAVKENKRIDFH